MPEGVAMDRAQFEASLAADGYDPALTRRMEAGGDASLHTHPFDARLLVLEGEFLLDQDGTTHRYGPGEAFEVPAGVPHAERFGPAGATYLVGRRQKG
jgi:quercetin dioxygenase-like cupin family protein